MIVLLGLFSHTNTAADLSPRSTQRDGGCQVLPIDTGRGSAIMPALRLQGKDQEGPPASTPAF